MASAAFKRDGRPDAQFGLPLRRGTTQQSYLKCLINGSVLTLRRTFTSLFVNDVIANHTSALTAESGA